MVNVVFGIGRTNPPTKGHKAVFDRIIREAKEHKCNAEFFIVDGVSTGKDKSKNPLSGEFRKQILSKWYPEIKFDIVVSAFDVLDILEVQNKTPFILITGEDRVSNYQKMLNYNSLSTQIIGLNRDEIGQNVSATSARNAVLNNDFETYLTLMPPSISRDDHKLVYDQIMEAMSNVGTNKL